MEEAANLPFARVRYGEREVSGDPSDLACGERVLLHVPEVAEGWEAGADEARPYREPARTFYRDEIQEVKAIVYFPYRTAGSTSTAATSVPSPGGRKEV